MFAKKRKLRMIYDEKLMESLEKAKEDWFQKRKIVKMSFGYQPEIENDAKIAQAKYLFLFREVRRRNISVKR